MTLFRWPPPPPRPVRPIRRCRPHLEELAPRLTPAQLGVNDFRISFMGSDGNPNFDALNSAVAYNSRNHEYLVVWQGDDFTDNEVEVFGQRIDAATGALLGGKIRLSDMGPNGDPNYGAFEPVVAYNVVNNEYLVVWRGDDNTAPLVEGEFEVFGQRLDAATGVEVGANDFRISDMGTDGDTRFPASEPAVAYNVVNNQYLVVWHGGDTNPQEIEIYGQRLDAATGIQVGDNDFRISDMGPDGNIIYEAFHPAVAYNPTNNEYLVVWRGDDDTAPLVNNEVEIFGQRLNAATGKEVGDNDFRISDMGPDGNTDFGAFDPAVAYNGINNEYLVVWDGNDGTVLVVNEEYEIFGQRLDAATGKEVGLNDFRISDMGPEGNIKFEAFTPAVAYNGLNNEYVVVWTGDDTTDNEYEVFGQRLAAATGAEVGANDFRLSDMGPDGDTTYVGFAPAVAYNVVNNEYLVVWHGDDNTAPLVNDELEIFGQRFSPLDPPSPPPPPPPPPPPAQLTAVAFRQRGLARMRVLDAATGAERGVLTPFPGYRGRLRLALRDLNGDGSLDLLVQAVVRGKRRKRAYDAVTLAPLPLNLA
jgi:hypothetical protein